MSARKIPRDVTDQYKKPELCNVTLTRPGAEIDGYTVHGRLVTHNKSTNIINCIGCRSTECDHVQEVKVYIGVN